MANPNNDNAGAKADLPPVPQSRETELALLGAFLVGTDGIEEAFAALDAEDFFDVRNRTIFIALRTLHREGKPTNDLALLVAALEESGKIETVGHDYAALIGDGCAQINPNIKHYARQLRQLSARRRAMAIGERASGPHADRALAEVAGLAERIAEPADPYEIATENDITLPDMPPSVLDGRLGELYRMRMSGFPIAFAWPAILAAASAILRPAAHRTNLYACLVGPTDVGKSSAIDRANFLLDVKPPILHELKSGSPEGLLKMIGDQHGDSALFAVGELSHLLEKAQIQGSTFSYILNDLFYKDEQHLTIAKGEKVKFHCRLSIVGGVVDKKFEDSFGAATVAGLYDRFCFGQCPTGYSYLWRPPEGEPFTTDLFDVPPVNSDVYAARDAMVANEKIRPRILEIALRCALICAALDGREELRAADLEPAWEFARYQSRARVLLQPNSGKNFEGVVAHKILQYLGQHAPHGQYMNVRQVLRGTHAYDIGPSVAERAVRAMVFGGAIEEHYDTMGKTAQKRRLIRLTGDWN